MPELPDVEVFRRYLDATSLHKRIARVRVRDEELLRGVSKRTLQRRLNGAFLRGTRRHGKYLLVDLEPGDWLALHFGMTGFLRYFRDPESEPAHVRLRLDFDNGYRLAYDCQRKLGEIRLVADPETFAEEKELGADVLELDREGFLERLEGRRGMIKTALMDQSLLAGVGNVYSDEALFQTEIHPETAVADLDGKTLGHLHRTLHRVLEKAIREKVERFPDSWLLPHREPGAGCPRCGGTIRRIEVAGRGCYICPDHQERG